jgi:hypothetical protein
MVLVQESLYKSFATPGILQHIHVVKFCLGRNGTKAPFLPSGVKLSRGLSEFEEFTLAYITLEIL